MATVSGADEEVLTVKKTVHRKEGIMIAAGICFVLLLVFLCVYFLSAGKTPDAREAGITAQPPAAETAETDRTEPTEAPKPAKGYVLVTTATRQGFLPLPEEEDYVFPLTQTMEDGTVWENVIHLTPEGVYMESSNCENHDCIEEGTVTLGNRNDRILGNMIVCLPHQMTLELFTPEEILTMVAESQQSQGR